MKARFLTLFFLIFFFTSFAKSTQVVETVTNILNQTIEINTEKDFHITSKDAALVNSTINLTTENSWLFFDSIKPSKVVENYGDMIYINGSKLIANKNARVSIYAQGTVIIPQDSTFQPLEVFSESNFTGTSAKYNLNNYYSPSGGTNNLSKPIGLMDNKIRSFKLKRGYMATLSNNPNGTEFSRVFIADREDINISQIQAELDKSISFIRVMRWEWPSKKGWAGWVDSDIDRMDATWFYTWAASQKSTINSEFVPERHHIDWPSFNEIGDATNVSHLLGLNEPDHVEQANASVNEAVAEWPRMLATGLRVGSPATTDFNWLYDFMNKCKALSYRVDFVVIHAYWGGLTPQQWYNALKEVHTRTGRPLWIKEWNNGANWTKESWPSGTAAQQQKQLNDLKGILQVMDTASFVERYSIYNWVEDKRAMILPDGSITPAGAYYRDNKSVMAYNSKKEVIPTWTPQNPTLYEPTLKKDNSGILLSWVDPNGSLNQGYIIERQVEDEDFKEIARINDPNTVTYSDNEKILKSGYIKYRIKTLVNSTELPSNITGYFVSSGISQLQYGSIAPNNDNWLICKYINTYKSNPIVVSGIPSYNNSGAIPLTQSINAIDTVSFSFRLAPWVYLNNPVFTKAESISYLSLPAGKYEWGDIKAEANLLQNINGVWKTITFTEPFQTVPVVFATQVTNRSQIPTTVRIHNVTNSGFDVMIQKEEAQTKVLARENVAYLAATPGTGIYENKKLIIGKTEENIVGSIYNSAKILFNDTFVQPAFFANMQTTNDEITSTLRYNKLSSDQAVIFKSREASVSNTQSNIAAETVGWMVLETDPDTMVNGIEHLFSASSITIYPNPVENTLHIKSTTGINFKSTIYNLLGENMLDKLSGNSVDVTSLSRGFYIIKINNAYTFRFFKK